MPAETLTAAEIERLAQKRAAARLGWSIHASVYLLVHLALWIAALGSGQHWAIFPTLGWGLGLAIHGAIVFAATPGAGLYQHLLQRERMRLQTQRDPW